MKPIRIERHNLDKVITFLPVKSLETHKQSWPDGPPKFCTPKYGNDGTTIIGYETTRRDEIKNQAAKGFKRYHGRIDIVVWSEKVERRCKDCGQTHECIGKQHLVYPGPGGSLRGDWELLSPEDLAWARIESFKCWEVAQTEPLFKAAIERT